MLEPKTFGEDVSERVPHDDARQGARKSAEPGIWKRSSSSIPGVSLSVSKVFSVI